MKGLTNRFHVAVLLFSNRSEFVTKCGKNFKVAHKVAAGCITNTPPHFDITCDYRTDLHQHRISLFCIAYKLNVVNGDVIFVFVLQQLISNNRSKCLHISAYHTIK